jgi:superfamily II DNA or RNA helicase
MEHPPRLAAPENTMEEQRAFMDAIEAVELDPDNQPLPVDNLVSNLSMWKAHADRMRIFPSQYDFDLIPETSTYYNLMRQQKLAICSAVGYMKYPDAREWRVADAAQEYGYDDGELEEEPPFAQVPESDLSIRPPQFKPSCQCQVEPPGSGKTAVILYLASLTSRNALVITNSRENAVQMVKAACQHTNISKSFPIKLIRSNAKEDGSSTMLQEEERALGVEFALRPSPASEHLHVIAHGGAYGISVIDANTFQELVQGSKDRHDLRLRIFGSEWDLVIIDEADSVLAKKVRWALNYGAVGSATEYELQTGKATGADLKNGVRYKLKYNKLVAMSGTWHRGDAAGHRFLSSIGPITYSITSSELENMGHLAKMTVCLVKCSDDDAWVRSRAKARHFASLTPEKLRVCERLVRLHVAHGQKIMIFTKNIWHLRMLERMFPFALAISGKTEPDDCTKILKRFKEPVCSGHPLVWITTSKGEVGMDVPDTCVVINLVNNGESARCLRQQMGRASRKLYKFGWMYSLVDQDETDWAYGLAGDTRFSSKELSERALRYKLLFKDGYGEKLVRLTSRELIESADRHVAWMQTPAFTQDDDVKHIVADAARDLFKGLLFESDVARLAIVDHVLTCVWGDHYEDEKHRTHETLFDTQSQLKLRQRASDTEDKKNRRKAEQAMKARRRALPTPGRQLLSNKRRKIDAEKKEPMGVFETKLLTCDEYNGFPIPEKIRTDGTMRSTLATSLNSAGVPERVGTSGVQENAQCLWSALMTMRSTVNARQYQSDRERRELCEDVLQMGEAVQETCSFLHGNANSEAL